MKNLEVSIDVPTEIRISRTFDAPRRLVFEAMTTPALLKRWLGGKRATVASVEIDPRPSGAYRYEYRLPDGGTFAFVGVFSEVSEACIVHTESMEGQPGEALVTTTLDEQGRKTLMTQTMRFESRGVRDAVLATGMADGAGESFHELAELLVH